jgi:hypothetical protein
MRRRRVREQDEMQLERVIEAATILEMRRVVEKGYLEQFTSWLPDTDEVHRAVAAVKRYVKKRLTP